MMQTTFSRHRSNGSAVIERIDMRGVALRQVTAAEGSWTIIPGRSVGTKLQEGSSAGQVGTRGHFSTTPHTAQ